MLTKAQFSDRADRVNQAAKKRGALDKITEVDISFHYVAQQELCYYCHEELNDRFHVDHLLPIARGGKNIFQNLAIVCEFCNQTKGVLTDEEYLKYLNRQMGRNKLSEPYYGG